MQRKRTHDSEDGKGDALARAARDEMQRWRESSPEAKDLPPEEIRLTRDERRARLELKSTIGNERAKRQVDEARRRDRDDKAERERLRRGRKRPHKHLPAGLAALSVIIEKPVAGKVPVACLCAKDAPGTETLLLAQPAYVTFVEVTPELARDAASLREALDYERHSPTTNPPVVRQEFADAIRSAAANVRRLVWIPFALQLVTIALSFRIAQARGAVDPYRLRGVPAPPTTPEAIYEELVRECQETGFALPAHVDAGTISWMLSHLAVAATRGGGRTRKLGAAKMRTILSDDKKLARAVPPKSLHRSAAKPV